MEREQRARLAAPRSAAAERAAAGRGCSGARTWLFSSTVPIFGFEEGSSLTAQIAAPSLGPTTFFRATHGRAVPASGSNGPNGCEKVKK